MVEQKSNPIARLLKPLGKLRGWGSTDESEENLVTQAARQQMNALHNTGNELRNDRQLLRAAEIYSRALEIAESIQDTWHIVHFRRHIGKSLADAGKLCGALAALTPTLQDSTASAHSMDFYITLVIYILIAQDLPVSLGAIEKAYAQAEDFLRDSGNTNWRHKLLLLRAQLYTYRGMFWEALARAQESWASRLVGENTPHFLPERHFIAFVDISLQLQDAKQARRYLAEWKRQTTCFPKSKEVMYCCNQSKLERLEGQAQKAVDWARRAVLAAEQVDAIQDRFLALSAMVRAFLCADDCERTRDILGRLFGLRHSENGHIRYGVRLLWGDYHLACARQAAGMAPADDEFGLEFPPPTSIADPQATRQALKRARRAYDAILKVGKWIDEQLECTVRQGAIAERFARIEAIEARL